MGTWGPFTVVDTIRRPLISHTETFRKSLMAFEPDNKLRGFDISSGPVHLGEGRVRHCLLVVFKAKKKRGNFFFFGDTVYL